MLFCIFLLLFRDFHFFRFSFFYFFFIMEKNSRKKIGIFRRACWAHTQPATDTDLMLMWFSTCLSRMFVETPVWIWYILLKWKVYRCAAEILIYGLLSCFEMCGFFLGSFCVLTEAFFYYLKIFWFSHLWLFLLFSLSLSTRSYFYSLWLSKFLGSLFLNPMLSLQFCFKLLSIFSEFSIEIYSLLYHFSHIFHHFSL